MAEGPAALDLSRNLLEDLFSHAHAALIGEERDAQTSEGHGHKRKGTDAHGAKRKTVLATPVGVGASRALGDDPSKSPASSLPPPGEKLVSREPTRFPRFPPPPLIPKKEVRVPTRPQAPITLPPPVIPTCLPATTCPTKVPCPTSSTFLARPTHPRPPPLEPQRLDSRTPLSPRKILKRMGVKPTSKPPTPPSPAPPPPTTYLITPPSDLATPPTYLTSSLYPSSQEVLASYLTSLPTYLAQFYARLTLSAASRLASHSTSPPTSCSSSYSSSSSSSSTSSSPSSSSPSFFSSFASMVSQDHDRHSPIRDGKEDQLNKSCTVCGDVANLLHSGRVSCEPCRAFFATSVSTEDYKTFSCRQNGTCGITAANRRSCKACRFVRCLRAGMHTSWAKRDEKDSPFGPTRARSFSEQESKDTEGYCSAPSPPGTPKPLDLTSNSERPVSPHARPSHSTIKIELPLRSSPSPGSTSRPSSRHPGSFSNLELGPRQDSESGPPFKLPVKTEPQKPFRSHRPSSSLHRLVCHERGGESSTATSSRLGCEGDPGERRAPRDTGRPLKDLESLLAPVDYSDLKELEDSYHLASEKISLPLENRMIRSEELGKLYSYFITRRAHFLVSTSLYKTLAPTDRPKLLRIAVSMCTYITGAHLMDTTKFMWPKQEEASQDSTTPTLSAGTVRQYLSHEQFVRLMRFYVTYSSYYCDERIAILMQVLSLAYPEAGLVDPGAVEEGRRRYGGLLSRYLLATYGPETGSNMFRALLNSQFEMRQLADINQHVELVPRVSQCEDVDVAEVLSKGMQLVCAGVKEVIERVLKQQKARENPGIPVPKQTEMDDLKGRSEDLEHLAVIENVLHRLAKCNDPKLLEEARRIIPTDLLKQFHKMLE